jgi:hypothetical protein
VSLAAKKGSSFLIQASPQTRQASVGEFKITKSATCFMASAWCAGSIWRVGEWHVKLSVAVFFSALGTSAMHFG